MGVIEIDIIYKRLESITPYDKNPRKNDEAVKYVAESIRQFGFKVPIVIDKNGIIVAGHTRYKAARELGIDEVPCIVADDLTDEQIRAFRLADNKVGEIAEWNDELLSIELGDIEGIDMTDFGFDFGEEGEEEERYTMDINIPQYEITGDCPELRDLVDTEKADELLAEIEGADIPNELKDFLSKAATRHYSFNYGNVAEYYAHASADVQSLMERSALVIIDVNDAIKYGYAKFNKSIKDILDGGE